MKGFTIYAQGKDVFIETHYTRRTKALAKKIIISLNRKCGCDIPPDNASAIDSVISNIHKAECEICELSDGRQMYKIHTEKPEKSSCCGIVGDETTLIIKL